MLDSLVVGFVLYLRNCTSREQVLRALLSITLRNDPSSEETARGDPSASHCRCKNRAYPAGDPFWVQPRSYRIRGFPVDIELVWILHQEQTEVKETKLLFAISFRGDLARWPGGLELQRRRYINWTLVFVHEFSPLPLEKVSQHFFSFHTKAAVKGQSLCPRHPFIRDPVCVGCAYSGSEVKPHGIGRRVSTFRLSTDGSTQVHF